MTEKNLQYHPSMIQHKISDLINILKDIEQEHGDLPIIYWDHNMACKFSDPKDIFVINNGILELGGFLNKGSMICPLTSIRMAHK
jgi:hypothetical protein